ncbi:MAG: CHAD domain-containing protein, partial [Thermoguttaceae bacterium]
MTRCSDPSYRILAARSLRKQVKQLAEHLGDIRLGEDIESIHRARVASRRLRAGLSMFRACWKQKQVKAWKKQIRQMARNLGEARDNDVLIEYLVSSLAAASDRALVPGIACLLNHVERQRLWLQPRVLKAIDRFETRGALKAMQEAVRGILEETRDTQFIADEYARGQAGRSIRKGLKKLLDEAPGLAAPEQHERHHAMRIAAKRLRYTLELARPTFAGNMANGDLADGVVRIGDTVKKLQTLLGEIHDCDVWVETFAEFAHNETGEIQIYFGSSQRFERLRPGFDYLQQERKDRRRKAFGELVIFWQELRDQGVWDRLATLLEWGGARAESQAILQEKSDDPSPVEVS